MLVGTVEDFKASTQENGQQPITLLRVFQPTAHVRSFLLHPCRGPKAAHHSGSGLEGADQSWMEVGAPEAALKMPRAAWRGHRPSVGLQGRLHATDTTL